MSEDPKSLEMVTAAMKLEDAYSLEGKLLMVRKIEGRRKRDNRG